MIWDVKALIWRHCNAEFPVRMAGARISTKNGATLACSLMFALPGYQPATQNTRPITGEIGPRMGAAAQYYKLGLLIRYTAANYRQYAWGNISDSPVLW